MDGQDHDVVAGHSEVDSVGKPPKDRSSRLASGTLELQGIVGDPFHCLVERLPERGAQANSAPFVPVARFECLRLGLWAETNLAGHSRSISFRRTALQGIADSGR